jgi:stage II sporulation protein D
MGIVILVSMVSASGVGGPTPVRAQTPAGDPVRFEIADGGLLEVNADARYLDTIELRHAGSGPILVNELSMDDYVAGIAEMPARWPLEALKAQAVAARTYGWYVARTSSYDGYDICATVACQVFRGADTVVDVPLGQRWREAVVATSGEVLLDADGGPVLARYFSTSGGRTYANEEAFPSSGPRDELIAIEDPYDEVSPFHRWTVTFTREEFDDILSRGDTLAAAVPVAEVQRVGATDDPGARLAVTGADGAEVDVDARDFQRFVSTVAPQRFPDRFPQLRDDGRSRLPSTVPSSRFAIRFGDDEVVLDGQGWGHGVGLGQYGARGRAEDGHDHQQILAAYYNGRVPTRSDDLPDRIRVGLPAPDEVRLRGDAPMRITAGDTIIEEAALGTWTVQGDGDGWAVQPPDGYGATLEVSATRLASHLGSFDDAIAVEAAVNKPVLLHLEVTDGGGEVVLQRPVGVAESGSHAAVWRLDDRDGSLVEPGHYQVALIGEDPAGDRDGTALAVSVPLDPPDEPDATTTAPPPLVGRDGPLRVPAIMLAVAALALAGVLVIRRAR